MYTHRGLAHETKVQVEQYQEEDNGVCDATTLPGKFVKKKSALLVGHTGRQVLSKRGWNSVSKGLTYPG